MKKFKKIIVIKSLLCIDNILQIENVYVVYDENREGDDERQFVHLSRSFSFSLSEKREKKSVDHFQSVQ